jgi:hypothetical protein
MDRSVPRLPTTTARLSITVRRFSITIGRSPTIPAVPTPRRLAFPAQRPGTGAWRRAIPAARRRLAIAGAWPPPSSCSPPCPPRWPGWRWTARSGT